MALVKCQECGKEISSEAVSCPGCGSSNKKPAGPKKATKQDVVIAVLVVAGMIYFATSTSSKPPAAPPAPSTSSSKPAEAAVAPETPVKANEPVAPVESGAKFEQIKPESIVFFKDGTFACLNKDDLSAMIEHSLKGEQTKANATLIGKGGSCFFVQPGKKVRVISAEYNDPDFDLGLLEVVGETIDSADGAWTFSTGAEVVPFSKGKKK